MRLGWHYRDKSLEPLVYVSEEKDEIVVHADLPCVKKEDIQVSVTDETVEIRAKMYREFRCDPWGTIQRGMIFQQFHKVVQLPARINPDLARARFQRGILEIRAQKKVVKSEVRVE
ncbi:MAG: hypothetical protein DRO11_06815 [Methanobacteriota archaeon]|nr:MAG: hypothetical protein DRO11_06815 [Euryarchaeota archaeon]